MMRLGVTSPYSNLITSSVPVGQEGLVHIWGQNNTTLKQALGISWIVRDPDELLVELYPDKKPIEWSDTGAGKDHEFIGGRFEFFKEGVYTIAVCLFMNQDDPAAVDSYDGALCTVVVEEEPEEPEEPEVPEEVFPWLPVILISGGVVLAAVALVPKKPKA